MKVRGVWIIWLAVLLALPVASRAQSKGHIKLTSVAEVEKELFNPEGKKVIQRIPAAEVLPGSEVIFTTRYENVGKQKAENAVITNPVPEHMLYTQNSAQGAGARVTFSIDNGKNYNIPSQLFVMDTAGHTFPARPRDYTHIRWTFANPLPSGAKGEVSFRAILK